MSDRHVGDENRHDGSNGGLTFRCAGNGGVNFQRRKVSAPGKPIVEGAVVQQ